MSELDDRLDAIFAARNREHMAPTIAATLEVLDAHPDAPRALYEVGGAYDTGGHPELAIGYYERALAAGLAGQLRRGCFVQYASSLRNLGRPAEAERMLAAAMEEFPGSPSLAVCLALVLQSLGRADEALALALETLADHSDSAEIRRHEAAIRGYAAAMRDTPAG